MRFSDRKPRTSTVNITSTSHRLAQPRPGVAPPSAPLPRGPRGGGEAQGDVIRPEGEYMLGNMRLKKVNGKLVVGALAGEADGEFEALSAGEIAEFRASMQTSVSINIGDREYSKA